SSHISEAPIYNRSHPGFSLIASKSAGYGASDLRVWEICGLSSLIFALAFKQTGVVIVRNDLRDGDQAGLWMGGIDQHIPVMAMGRDGARHFQQRCVVGCEPLGADTLGGVAGRILEPIRWQLVQPDAAAT